MARKYLFWTVTILLVLLASYVLTTVVIKPVVSKSPLYVAPVNNVADSPAEPNAKKTGKDEGPVKKTEKTEKGTKKGAKKPETKVPAKTENLEPVVNSKEDLQTLYELKKQESLLKSRYSLSDEDSCYLILDLVQKVARLEMKGIPLQDCEIKNIIVSNSILKYHDENLLKWISQPFVLKNVVSTIERVQFLVKNAPKDTIEANKADAIPVPRRTEDVFILMNFERNLQLVIQQSELSEGADKARIDSIKQSLFKKETDKSIKALVNLKREAIVPQISITLSKADAITLYRALPQRLKMVLRL
ncbi:MAG: hypothetical protein LWW85_03015 [Marinilabiliales bacterium]|nr:hypothetical protein [Marinilabiliales bacterium]